MVGVQIGNFYVVGFFPHRFFGEGECWFLFIEKYLFQHLYLLESGKFPFVTPNVSSASQFSGLKLNALGSVESGGKLGKETAWIKY